MESSHGDMAGQLMTIRLSRVDAQPWGFRLQGGKDFAAPLVVQKVNGGSLAEQAGLLAGDALVKVNNVDVFNMRHKDAQDVVVRSGNTFDITIQRGGSVWRPQVTPTGSIPSQASHVGNSVPTVTQTSLAYKPQEVRHIGSGYNNAARPFSSVNGSDGQVKSIVNKQYNTPVGIYSEEAIAETLSAQAEVLAGGVLGVNFKKNEKIYNAANSEVLKMLHEQENDNEPVEEHHAPANFFWTASHAVGGAAGVKSHHRGEEHHQPQAPAQPKQQEDERIGTPLKQNTLAPSAPHRPSLPGQAPPLPAASTYQPQQTYYPEAPVASAPVAPAPVPTPAPKPTAPTAGVSPNSGVAKPGGGIGCDNCGVTITGVFVRIKDKNLHAECFKCATCGTNLKNQGYFNFNNKLYCDIHARLAAMNNPPKGTEGFTPLPVKPATKLSANTISAALDNYTQHNGSSNHETNANVNTSSVSPSSHTHSRTSSSSSSINSSAGISSSHSTISSLSPDKSTSSPEKLSPAHSRQSSENGSTNVVVHHQQYPVTGTGVIRTNSRTMSPVMPSPPSPPPPPLPLDQQILPPPAATITYSNEITINHKPKDNDMKNGNKINNNGIIECILNGGRITNNGSGIGNGCTSDGSGRDGNGTGNTSGYDTETGSDSGQHVLPSQTKVYNKFLKKYSNKMQSDFLDGNINSDHKSYPAAAPTLLTPIASGPKSKIINDSNDSHGNIKMTSMVAGSYSSTQNGYGDTNDPIYGTIRPETRNNSNEEFKYVTLDGSVIRSVIPPGKGVKTNYKLNTGYGGPKPFNSSPLSPPMRGPQSPSIYPPPTTAQTWDTPTKPQSKPQVNPYATLPRTAGHSHEESQQQSCLYEQQVCEQKQQYQQDRSIFEEDVEIIEVNRQQAGHFKWPPPADENRNTPTATPLYIPPPETQHVVPKPHVEKPPEQQWQSRSAPELTTSQQKAMEIESSSDSLTSTSITTTTTSEEYHRMYQAQVQAYQMQQAYEQYGSEMDYHMDMEVASMQQNQSFASVDFYSAHSGRRSAQECVEYITGPLSTQHLVDLVRAVTPKPETPPPKPQRKVEFSDEVQIKQEKVAMAKKLSEEAMEMRNSDKKQAKKENRQEEKQEIVKEQKSDEFRPAPAVVTPESRKFTATPEIKIEIPEVKPIPPSNIPNPVPKEWISPMVKALTTAPDKPIEMTETSISEANRRFESVHFHEDKSEKIIEEQTKPAEKPVEPEILKEEPPKGSFISRTMTTAPPDPLKFLDNYGNPVPLPEETEPYMPPPIDMKPYYRDDYRPKSPFLTALTIAPDRPYTPYGHDVCSQLLDLPTPKEKLTMVDALTVASSRGYTPLSVTNATVTAGEQKSSVQSNNYEFFSQSGLVTNQSCQSTELNRQTSAFANVKGNSTLSPFQPRRESLSSSTTNTTQTGGQNSVIPQTQSHFSEKRESYQSQERVTSMQQQSMFQSVSSTTTATSGASCYHSMNQTACTQSSTTCGKDQQQSQTNATYHRHQQIQLQQQQQQQKPQESDQKLIFPPAPGPMAKKTLQSGLHKPDNIPQYQRNWTVLPTQRPVRTPEPPELKENVPLAFVDTHTPRELTPSVECSAQSKIAVATSSANKQHVSATCTETKASETQQRSLEQQQRTEEKYKTALPIIVTENNAPVTMAFQSLDIDHSNAHPRPYTPSLINKPAPVIPYYQTPDKLVSEECPATSARLYDPRSPSPLPDRARSPAPGPPPNPLSTIRAPRIRDPPHPEAISNYQPSARSELTSTYRPPIQAGSITTGQSYYGTQQAQFQTQEQNHVVSHVQTGYQAGSQRYTDKPEVYQKTQIGDTMIQTRSKESQFNEENRSALETKSTTQVGNTQIERRRKVVEEFEHTQTAKTIEIRKTQGGEEKQITQTQPAGRTGFVANQARRLSSLEQEIASISSQSKAISARAANLASSPIFPRYKSPESVSTFPISPEMLTHDEPTRPTYVVSASAYNQTVGESASKKASDAAKIALNTSHTPSSQQQYRNAAQSQSNSTSAAKSSITKASSSSVSSSAATSQASAALNTDFSRLTNTTSSAIPVPAFKAPTPYTSSAGPSADQLLTNAAQQLAPPSQPPSQPNTNNVAYKPPNSETGLAGMPAPPPPPPTSSNIVPNVVNDPSPASAGPTSKGGSFGATSAPKRGRGILNKAVGPGVRVPICGCCHTHIRGPFITALGRIWCPEHFVCVNGNCRRPLQDIGFVEEKGDLYCEYCFEKYLAPTCSKCNTKIKGDCLNAIGKHYHPECFTCAYCGKLFGNSPFFLEEGEAYCEADWNELFTTKCFACGFPVEAGDRWVEALNHNYHSQCFNCTMCKKNLEGQSFYNKGGRPFCKNHAR